MSESSLNEMSLVTPRPVPASARPLFGVPVEPISLQDALDRIDVAIQRRTRLQIGVVNAAKLVNMRRDPLLRDDVLSSDLILADGTAVVWAGRLLGVALPERVAGIDLMFGMLARGDRQGYRVYCLGASEDVSQRVVRRIASEFPGVTVVGRRDGYFKEADEPALAQEIAASRADILFVAMTSPKKEKFLGRWAPQLGVPVCHGVGGSFDVLAGKVQRAPLAWQRLGLEWLYRVKQEPGRLWKRYLVTNTIFCAMVLAELAHQLPRRLWR